MKKFLLFTAWMFAAMSFSYAQTTITGKVIDEDSQEEIIGAAVILKGTTIGSSTDIAGEFAIQTNNEGPTTLVVSFIGMKTKEVEVVLEGEKVNAGTIALASDVMNLKEIQVLADVAIDRKTPVAVSTVTPEIIETKLGNQEFPEIMKSTPGVYTTKQGGGWGDSRITIRGFGDDNTAVMINGIPVNDMENSRVYWSNWAGLSDVTRNIQIQRGMGASKLALPTAGGTMNILTRSSDAEKGGSISSTIGNDGYAKFAFDVSTGLNDKGWALTIAASQTSGNGFVDGTSFEGYSYFANITKVINSNHTLSLNAFGASQTHGQRRTRHTIEDAEKVGNRHNYDWGYLQGEEFHANENYYSKPLFSLNHYWTINDRTSLNTSAYASFGRGGGSSVYGDVDRIGGDKYAPLDFDAVYERNAQQGQSSTIMRAGVNNHDWYGVISTLTHELNSDFTLTGGIDGRYYYGEHYQEVDNLIGGQYFITERTIGGEKQRVVAREGDKVGYDNDGQVIWASAFGQVEYDKNDLSAFLNAAVSNVNYQRIDYSAANPYSEHVNALTYSLKGGANYRLTEKHNVFANAGYFQRPPMFNAVYQNHTNNINTDAVNESIMSFELGYGYRSAKFAANANIYYTKWMDKSMTKSHRPEDGNPDGSDDLYANILGIDAVHKGIEVDFEYRPTLRWTITGMISVGDWRWANNVDATFFDQDQNQIGDEETLYIKDLKVGNSAQTTAALGTNYEVLKDFKIGVDYVFAGNNYSDYDPTKRTDSATEGVQSYKLPNFGLVDIYANYNFKMGKLDASLFGKINNVGNTSYIADATDFNGTWQGAQVYYAIGRTWSGGLKVKF
ncbi:TonB-dependent receptor [Sediminitomix flava]|uniref:Outer membrane receptor protein involved in Fe transport n=1 Tax=Sediminitomix flava TaxID=379075 RepID=A0A315ZAK9_SEDFL|nr:TonB-dependent receptor [Sediminitomix flava]PWJ42626.1 outer membrane receptor protein involved in Fe transport [Sediminitomix flava]